MSGTKVPRDPNLPPEMRRFLDDISRAVDTLNAAGYAPLASPTFTGDPKAPTASPGDNDTSISTTAFVTAAISTAIAALPAPPPTQSAVNAWTGSNTDEITSLTSGKFLIVSLQNLSHNNGANQTLRIELDANNGASYSSAFTVSASVSNATSVSGLVIISRADSQNYVITGLVGGTMSNQILAEAGAVNAIRLSWSAGNNDSGDWTVFSL